MDSKKNQSANKLNKKKVVSKKRKVLSTDKSPVKVSNKRAKVSKNSDSASGDIQSSQISANSSSGVQGVSLNSDDLNSIVEKVTLPLAGKFPSLIEPKDKSPPDSDLVVQNDEVLLQDKPDFQSRPCEGELSLPKDNLSSDSNQNNGNSEAALAKAKADALMLELNRFKEASKRDDAIKLNADGQYIFTLGNGQNVQVSAGQLHNLVNGQMGSGAPSAGGHSNNLQRFGGNSSADNNQQQFIQQNKPQDLPNFGAFGEIKHKSSLLAVNSLNDNSCQWHDDGCQNRQPRLLKSGLNRSYNDLVVRELIWPNDLVLSGSEKVKLLDMSHSEFFLAIIKTLSGTLHDCPQNVNTANLLKYFNGMFRDAKDDSLPITLRAHKTVMGQLEKGELSLEAGWREWDDVRKHSVLSQTLHNISTVRAKNKNVGSAPTQKNKNQQNDGSNNGPRNRIDKACSFYQLQQVFQKRRS